MKTGITIENLPEDLARKFVASLEKGIRGDAPAIYAEIAANATDGHMRDAGIGAGRRSRDDKGPLRIVSGRLAQSLIGKAGNTEGIRRIRSDGSTLDIEYGTTVPYARPNEKGFTGNVIVRSHQRTISKVFGRSITPKAVTVGAHTRFTVLPARPYLEPGFRDSKDWVLARLQRTTAQATREALAA